MFYLNCKYEVLFQTIKSMYHHVGFWSTKGTVLLKNISTAVFLQQKIELRKATVRMDYINVLCIQSDLERPFN